MWPALDQFFARGAPLPLRGSAALGSLRLAPKGQGRREDNLQKEIYTPPVTYAEGNGCNVRLAVQTKPQ